MKFGEFLVEHGLVSVDAVDEALSLQRYRKTKLGRLLRDLGVISQETLNTVLIQFLRARNSESVASLLAKVSIADIPPDMSSWLVSRSLVATQIDSFAVQAITTEVHDEVIEAFEREFGLKLLVGMVEPHVFDYLKKAGGKNSGYKKDQDFSVSEKFTDDQKINVDHPYVKLYRECIVIAKRNGISDVHIEPKADSVQIRFRVHGDLETWKTLNKEHRDSVISKVKWLTNLDLSVSGKPQDARATYYSLKLNLRINALPSRHGDKIVLRLLDQEKEFCIEKSGLDHDSLSELRRASDLKNGLIIISGPTGSGKTTTLYGLIHSLDHRRKNVTTLEDPSEYELPGVTQTEISNHLTFASALRALMRQDPDVILLGEIRDEETAKLSFKIANTGHLVISTLHANGAIESIERLKHLGVDEFSIGSCLRFTGAQRLVKKICPACNLPELCARAEECIAEMGIKTAAENFFRRNPDGCPECTHGITGRLPVLEYATAAGVASYLKKNESEGCLKTSLREAAFKLAEKGLTDLEEVMHVS